MLVFFLINRMMSDYKVEMINDGMQEFYVHFHGPNESKFSFVFIYVTCFRAFFELFLVKKVGLLLRVCGN